MKTRDVNPYRYSVNTWTKRHEQVGHECVHATLDSAKADARARWKEHEGRYRVSIFDDGTGTYALHLEAGPVERRDLPCHDPEHDPSPPETRRVKSKRNLTRRK